MDDAQTRAKTQAHTQADSLARTLTILNALAEGVHPATGEVFAPDCPYHSPEIVRALYGAVRRLEGTASSSDGQVPERSRPETPRSETARPERAREGAPANAGKPWSVEEDRQLLVEFDSGKTLKECAVLHQRTFAGIEARLEKLGRLDAADRTTSRRVPARPGNGIARTG